MKFAIVLNSKKLTLFIEIFNRNLGAWCQDLKKPLFLLFIEALFFNRFNDSRYLEHQSSKDNDENYSQNDYCEDIAEDYCEEDYCFGK